VLSVCGNTLKQFIVCSTTHSANGGRFGGTSRFRWLRRMNASIFLSII